MSGCWSANIWEGYCYNVKKNNLKKALKGFKGPNRESRGLYIVKRRGRKYYRQKGRIIEFETAAQLKKFV
jgi:hypothetical protein